MLGWADVDWLRAAGYLAVAALCLVVGKLDNPSVPGYWRAFWPLTAALLAAMAVGRFGDVGGALIELARDEASADGWYPERRRFQALVVGAIGAAWLIAVCVACLRIPERRHRYLRVVLVVMTLCAFVAVRLVSLHQIDSVLHRRHVAGMRVGTWTEYALTLVLAVVVIAAPSGRRTRAGQPPDAMVTAIE